MSTKKAIAAPVRVTFRQRVSNSEDVISETLLVVVRPSTGDRVWLNGNPFIVSMLDHFPITHDERNRGSMPSCVVWLVPQ